MRAQLRRRLEMAERVRDFLRAHQTDGVGQPNAVVNLKQLVRPAGLDRGVDREASPRAR